MLTPPLMSWLQRLSLLLPLLLMACGGADGPRPEAVGSPAADRAQALASASAAAATAPQRWSDPATWGGTLPGAGASVLIPAGREVVLDGATPPLRTLVIEGSLVADPARDVSITADGVFVRGGRLAIGTAAEPHRGRAVITLTGATTADLPGLGGFGAKVLAQMGGTLELHGRSLAHSWTRLDGGDVPAGARRLTLAQAPGWRVGDRIVIASSSFDAAEHDVAEIESIDGRTLTLKQPLRWRHDGAQRQVGGRSVDTRAAVGLLNRNVVVRGDEASAALNIGGHAMFMAGSAGATVQISGVEFAHMGQLNVLGRYPIHFHVMAGNCRACYVRDSSVRDTLQRGIVLHDTSGVTLARNVIYNTVGHNVVVETEHTTGNLIEANLALVNRQPQPLHTEPTLVLQNDRLPSNFWFKSGRNAVVGNVAAGAQASGFNYDFINGDPIDFRGNSASAAMGRSGAGEGDFDIFGGLLISSEDTRPVTDRIEDVLAYRNAVGIWPEENGVTRINRFVAAENGINVVGRGVGNRVHLRDGLLVGALPGSAHQPGPALHYTYGSETTMEQVVFAGYGAAVNISAGETAPPQSFVALGGVSFIGARPALDFGDLLTYEMLDDSLLPRGWYVTEQAPWMATGECTRAVINSSDPDVYTFFHCPRRYAVSELDVRSGGAVGTQRVNPWLLRSDNLRYRRAGGDAGMASGQHGTTVLVDAGLSYRLDQPAKTEVQALRLAHEGLLHEAQAPGAALALSVAVPLAAPPQAVHRTGTRFDRPDAPTAASAMRAAASLSDFEANPMTTYLWEPAAHRLWVKASNRWVIVQP